MSEEQQSNPRRPRSAETREAEDAPTDWVNPRQLLTPAPQDGKKFRWIRTAMVGQADTKNVSSKLREGWRPCSANDFPEFENFRNTTGNIEYGGLMLCWTTDKVVEQRNKYFERINSSQIEAVDNNMMRESDPRMPMSKPERRTRNTFGRGG